MLRVHQGKGSELNDSDERSRASNLLSSSPRELGEWLAQWALRREKVLELLDRRAAHAARLLADRCFQLSRRQATLPAAEWKRAWQSLKLEVSGFLAERRSSGVMPAVTGSSVPPTSSSRNSVVPDPLRSPTLHPRDPLGPRSEIRGILSSDDPNDVSKPIGRDAAGFKA